MLRAKAETFSLECITSLPSHWEVAVGDWWLGGLEPRRQRGGLSESASQGLGGRALGERTQWLEVGGSETGDFNKSH